MDLSEIDIGRTVDILEYFLENLNSNLYIISIKNNDLDLSYLRKFQIQMKKNIVIIRKDNIIEEYKINRSIYNENIEIIKKGNINIELFVLKYTYWKLCIYYFKCFEIFLKLNKLQQRNIINDTYL